MVDLLPEFYEEFILWVKVVDLIFMAPNLSYAVFHMEFSENRMKTVKIILKKYAGHQFFLTNSFNLVGFFVQLF